MSGSSTSLDGNLELTGSAYIRPDFVHNLGILWDSILTGEAQTAAVTFAGMMMLNDRKMWNHWKEISQSWESRKHDKEMCETPPIKIELFTCFHDSNTLTTLLYIPAVAYYKRLVDETNSRRSP